MEDFVDHMFPNLEHSDVIPESIILTPRNKVNTLDISFKVMIEEMNLANDIIIKKYKPNDDLLTSHAINSPYNDDIPLSQKKMDEFMCGSLPPTDLYFKIGCILMLLRNWRLSEGIQMLSLKNISQTLRFS